MTEPIARIFVATPTYTDALAYECARSMQAATVFCLARGLFLNWVFVNGVTLVQCARDWLTAEFLGRPEFTHLLWLDDDMGFDPDAIVKLFDSDLDVVGGVAPCRDLTLATNFRHIPLGEAIGYLQPCAWLPGGFLLIKRHAVEAVTRRVEHYEMSASDETRVVPHVFDVPLYQANPGTKRVLPEDFSFGARLIEAGFPLYARTDINFWHVGRHVWHGKLSSQGVPET